MLPRSVYELLPSLYLMTGIVVVLNLESKIGFVSGAVFYWAGSKIWIMRSNARRRDLYRRKGTKRIRIKPPKGVIPLGLYEALPFLYIACGLYLVAQFNQASIYPSAFLLILAGVTVLTMRSNARAHRSAARVSVRVPRKVRYDLSMP